MPTDVAITGKEVVEYAVLIGTGRPYVLGASGPNAYDCSGLILAVFKHFAIATFPNLPREAGAQARWLAVNGEQISISAASNTPGAVLAIDHGPSGSGAGGNHIGFCLSPGLSFEARSTRYGIGSWVLSTRKWTGAYLIPHIDYSFTPPDPPPTLEDDMPYVMIAVSGFSNVFAAFESGVIRQMVLAEFLWLKDKKGVEVITDSSADGAQRLIVQAGGTPNDLVSV